MEYKIARIPKRNGEYREVFIASDADCIRLRKLLPSLEKILTEIDDVKVNYAFVKGRNCALNALQHVGYRYTISMDLKNFFASVRREHVSELIPSEILDQCLIHDTPHQGLPTSPLIATIAFLKYDRKIMQLLQAYGFKSVYTRYADDLTFSFNDLRYKDAILSIVRHSIEDSGFIINDSKTRIQDARNGRVIINGIALDEETIQAARRTRRNIRAAKHQNNVDSMRGLIEWSKCKLPRTSRVK